MVKAIFFDVDGTLLSFGEKDVLDSTKAALNKLAEKGIKRVIATGRHTLEMALLPVNKIKFDAYITLNGQLCLDADGTVISSNPITGADKKLIVELFNKKALPIMLVEKNRMYINYINRSVIVAQNAIATPVPDIGVYTGNEIYQVIVYAEQEHIDKLEKQLSNCKVTRWNDQAIDINAFSKGKAFGIEEYLKLNNIKQEETMAFGDGENDIEMLKYVHTGVAMGNAKEITKQNADYITGSVEEDGVMKALLALNVID